MKVKLNNTSREEDNKKRIKRVRDKYVSENKRINESKKKIREEKEKIIAEKNNIKKRKFEQFSKTKVGSFFARIGAFFRTDKEGYSFAEVFIITMFSLLVGAFSCFSIMMIICGSKNYFVLFKELNKFIEVYETISNNYYEDIDKNLLIEAAIDGMVSSVGDVYTNYADKEGAGNFDEVVTGTYEGIGCTIQLQEIGIVVVDVFQDGPAYKAGLMPGDIILFVDDKDSSEMSVDKIAEYIKTVDKSDIKMIVSRDGIETEIELVRGKVETPVVSSSIYEKNGKKVGYLNISMFTSAAYSQFDNKLSSLEKDGIDALVIDVRGNNGGYLTTVTDIANSLLSKGDIIYQIEKDGELKVTKDKTINKKNYPISILVNGSSASASEILAAAIKESYGGYVVGTRTYGKGTVQQVKKLSDGSMIKYTIEKWLTPDGNFVDGLGISPTHEEEISSEYYNNPIVENDNQLQKALELVSDNIKEW